MPEGTSNWISDPYFDEQGRPYVIYKMDGPGYKAGDRRYISPAEVHPSNAWGQDPRLLAWAQQMQASKPGQSFLRNRPHWDSDEGEWDRGINWTNILSAAVGGGIGAGALNAAGIIGGAGGGGAAGSGGPLASSSVPVSASMHGPATAAMGSAGASAGVPLGAVAPAAAGAGAAAGGSALKKVLDALSAAAPVALPLAAGALTPGGGGGNSGTGDLNRIAQITEARMRRADPLHQAAVQLAFAGMPTYGKQGINLPQVPLP
jgi:hypothetical protein